MSPLDGLLVLDFSTLLPGPMATLMLAEAGAEVIKIEPPTGEAMRHYEPKWGDDSAIFSILNRGKKSVVADLKSKAALDQVIDLIRKADILVEQFRPGVMERLGLGYPALSALNSKLIYCSITGYGQTGPRAPDAGHDLNFIAETGFLALSMGSAEDAVLPATPIGDIGGGAYPAMINILLALEERRKTGRGRHLDIAMSENIFPFQYWALAQGFATGTWPAERDELITGASPRYRVYATKDKKALVVAALEPKFWNTFCDVIGLSDEFRRTSIHSQPALKEIASIIAMDDASIWEARFAGKDCCCALVDDLAKAVSSPHFVTRGVFSAKLTNERGERIPALPMPLDKAFRVSPDGEVASPPLGSANAEYMREPHER